MFCQYRPHVKIRCSNYRRPTLGEVFVEGLKKKEENQGLDCHRIRQRKICEPDTAVVESHSRLCYLCTRSTLWQRGEGCTFSASHENQQFLTPKRDFIIFKSSRKSRECREWRLIAIPKCSIVLFFLAKSAFKLKRKILYISVINTIYKYLMTLHAKLFLLLLRVNLKQPKW